MHQSWQSPSGVAGSGSQGSPGLIERRPPTGFGEGRSVPTRRLAVAARFRLCRSNHSREEFGHACVGVCIRLKPFCPCRSDGHHRCSWAAWSSPCRARRCQDQGGQGDARIRQHVGERGGKAGRMCALDFVPHLPGGCAAIAEIVTAIAAFHGAQLCQARRGPACGDRFASVAISSLCGSSPPVALPNRMPRPSACRESPYPRRVHHHWYCGRDHGLASGNMSATEVARQLGCAPSKLYLHLPGSSRGHRQAIRTNDAAHAG
jgi:hypothetical protein